MDVVAELTRAADLRRVGREDEAHGSLAELYRHPRFAREPARLRRVALRQLLDDPALPPRSPSAPLYDAMWAALQPLAALAAASHDPADAMILQRCRGLLARWREPPRFRGVG